MFLFKIKLFPVHCQSKYGFLREGSSHYQFLITRWLCEIRLVAEEKNDLETIEAIKEHLPNMIEACRFFLVENNQKKSNKI